MLVPFYWTTQHQTPADHNLDTHQHENFKFYTTWLLIKYHIVKLSSKNSKENHWIEYNWCLNSTYKIIYCFKASIYMKTNIKMTYPVDIFITFVVYVSLDPHHIHSLCLNSVHSSLQHHGGIKFCANGLRHIQRVCWHFLIHSGIGDIKNNYSGEMRYEQRNDHISSQHSQTSISLTKIAAIWCIFF